MFLQQQRFEHAFHPAWSHADILQAPIKWESVDVTPQLKDGKTVIPDRAIDSVKTNYVALKGPLAVRLDLT
jgi:isocitrate dehydrogenase